MILECARLDKVVVKLRATQPKFYEEYQAARVVVGNGRPAEKNAKIVAMPNAGTVAPVARAA